MSQLPMASSSIRRFASLSLLLLGVTRGASALVACDSGQIALGTIFVHITVHNEAAIFDPSCTSVDFKSGGTDDNICGLYSGGSDVDCDASNVPQSGLLSNGTTFGNCVSNVHDCDNISKVQYCCDLL